MKAIALTLAAIVAVATAVESDMKLEGNKYLFKYSTDDAGGHKREETSNGDGSVSGSYSYIDPNGNLRKVDYKAGAGIGFQASGDISVDKKTAEEAAKLAELAPKAPVATVPELKAPWSPFTYMPFGIPAVAPAPLVYTIPNAKVATNILPYGLFPQPFLL